MKRKYGKYISVLLTLLVILLFGVYIYRNPEILSELVEIKVEYILLTMFLFLVVFLLEGLFIKITLSVFDKDITVKESFYLSTLSRIGNYLLPMRAGAIFRATYLKKKYDFDYSKFLSTLYGYYIILFLLYSVLGVSSLLVKSFVYNERFVTLILFFVALFLGMLFLMFVRIPFKKIIKKEKSILGKVVAFLDRFMQSWDRIVKNKKLLIWLLLITFGNILVNTVIIFIEFLSLHIAVNFFDLLLYSSLSGVSLLISLTPGSLGIREGVFLITSQSIGLTQEQILQIAIVDRGILFVLLLIMMIFTFLFLKEFKLKEVFFAKKQD
jgi:uncharacterized protein (TIRG00374 family)